MSTFNSPTRSYILCATPRSGSTLLCDLLESTGIAGHPAEHFETLDTTGLPRQPRQYLPDGSPATELLAPTNPGAPDPDLHLDEAFAAGTTPNGVFATKVMWGFLPDLLRRARRHTGQRDATDAALLAAVFPGVRYARVQRQDKTAQAVSLWTAMQTLVWRADGTSAAGPSDPVYSFDGIDHLVTLLTEQEQAWTRWTQAQGLDAPVVVYEDLVADPQDVVSGLLRALDLAGGRVDVPPPRLRRQSDDRSAEWIAAYRAEAGG